MFYTILAARAGAQNSPLDLTIGLILCGYQFFTSGLLLASSWMRRVTGSLCEREVQKQLLFCDFSLFWELSESVLLTCLGELISIELIVKKLFSPSFPLNVFRQMLMYVCTCFISYFFYICWCKTKCYSWPVWLRYISVFFKWFEFRQFAI